MHERRENASSIVHPLWERAETPEVHGFSMDSPWLLPCSSLLSTGRPLLCTMGDASPTSDSNAIVHA